MKDEREDIRSHLHEHFFVGLLWIKRCQKHAEIRRNCGRTCFFACSSNLEPSYKSLRARFSILALSFASCFSSFLTSTREALQTQYIRLDASRSGFCVRTFPC